MPKVSRTKPTADEIAEMAARGKDVSAYFTNKFTVVKPVRRVNVDLTQGMLRELDERAARLNISRQAVIKTLLGRALNDERASRTASKKKATELTFPAARKSPRRRTKTPSRHLPSGWTAPRFQTAEAWLF